MVVVFYVSYCFLKNNTGYFNNFLISKLFFDIPIKYSYIMGLQLHEYNNFYVSEINLDEYCFLFKVDINISKLENFLNDIIIEQEFFFKKQEFIFSNEDLKTKRYLILNKYDVMLKNRFIYKQDLLDFFIINKKKYKEMEDLAKVLKYNVKDYLVFTQSYRRALESYNKPVIEYDFNLKSDEILFIDLSVLQKYYYHKYGLKLVK